MSKEEQTHSRCSQLQLLGLKFNGEYYNLKTENYFIAVHWTDITCDTEEQWTQKINELTQLKNKYSD